MLVCTEVSNLDYPAIPESGRPGITIHGKDAQAIYFVLRQWFVSSYSFSIPPELNVYKYKQTDDLICWERIGYEVPLLVNMQPAGEYLGEDFHRAGGVPAVVAELIAMGKIDRERDHGQRQVAPREQRGRIRERSLRVVASHDAPMRGQSSFLNLKGNLFDSAIMKTSVISDEFRERYLENPVDPNAFEGRAIVFEGPEDYHARIDDPALESTRTRCS